MLRTRKSMSIVMVLCLCIAMLAPMIVAVPQAQALTTSASNTPTVARPGTNQTLGAIILDFGVLNASPAGGHRAVIKLPENFAYLSAAGAAVAAGTNVTAQRLNDISGTNTAGVVFNTTAGYVVNLTQLSDNQMQVTIVNPAMVQNVKFAITMSNITVPSSATDTINAIVMKLDGDFADGMVAIGKTSAGGSVDMIRSDPPTVAANTNAVIMNSTTGATTFMIHVREDVAAALQQGDSLKIKLPKGVTWVGAGGAGYNVAQFPGTTPLVAGDPVTAIAADNSQLVINRTTVGGAAAIAGKYTFTITNASIAIDPDVAAFGDIVATVTGTTTSNTSELKLCTYADFGYSVTATTPDTKLIAGKTGEIISNIVLKEKQAGSLLEGRTITMTLPDGVFWKDNATLAGTKSSGGLLFNFAQSASDPAKATATVTVTGAATQTTSKGELNFEKFEVDVAPDFKGPIEIQISGSAGINDKIKVGEVVAPITATGESKDVIIGVQKQAAGKIVIAEAKAGDIKSRQQVMTAAGPAAALANGNGAAGTMTNLVLSAPFGVMWNKVPTVKVAEGDISLGTPTIGWALVGGRTHDLTIPVKSTSSKASKIEISDIVYDLDRTVPEGDMTISIGGDAVAQTAAGWDAWANRDTAASVVAAKVITPAPKEGTTGAVAGQFKIASNIYSVNGVAKVMDAAPYIKAGRTYVPVKFLGLALGVAEKDIVWDATAQKATLTLGDKKVELTIGSTSYTVNGEAKTMDVAPEINNGRTMLPAKYVAEGLGFQVGWDAATGTVLVSK